MIDLYNILPRLRNALTDLAFYSTYTNFAQILSKHYN